MSYPIRLNVKATAPNGLPFAEIEWHLDIDVPVIPRIGEHIMIGSRLLPIVKIIHVLEARVVVTAEFQLKRHTLSDVERSAVEWLNERTGNNHLHRLQGGL